MMTILFEVHDANLDVNTPLLASFITAFSASVLIVRFLLMRARFYDLMTTLT